MAIMDVLLVGIGGAIGASLRFLVSGVAPRTRDMPTGTLIVNVIGSTVLSFITFSTLDPSIHLVNIGILGSFTTFSTFAFESFRFLEQSDPYKFLANITLNLTMCITGVAIGHILANLI
ncbi:MAG: CrcB family protein [Methanosarcinaceae archaeon]|nr:CrcB family protein [Methanosarcinaceae archaeon]